MVVELEGLSNVVEVAKASKCSAFFVDSQHSNYRALVLGMCVRICVYYICVYITAC